VGLVKKGQTEKNTRVIPNDNGAKKGQSCPVEKLRKKNQWGENEKKGPPKAKKKNESRKGIPLSNGEPIDRQTEQLSKNFLNNEKRKIAPERKRLPMKGEESRNWGARCLKNPGEKGKSSKKNSFSRRQSRHSEKEERKKSNAALEGEKGGEVKKRRLVKRRGTGEKAPALSLRPENPTRRNSGGKFNPKLPVPRVFHGETR